MPGVVKIEPVIFLNMIKQLVKQSGNSAFALKAYFVDSRMVIPHSLFVSLIFPGN
jgi:hypothetical protein